MGGLHYQVNIGTSDAAAHSVASEFYIDIKAEHRVGGKPAKRRP